MWSVAAIGRQEQVKREITEQMSNIVTSEPGHSLKISAEAIIYQAIEAQDPLVVMRVIASGEQIRNNRGLPEGSVSNKISILVEPV